MRHLIPILTCWAVVGMAIAPAAGQTTPTADAETLERVELANHSPYQGLIESEDDAWIYMVEIRRPPGRPMHLVVRPIDRRLVTKSIHLDAARRLKLRQEIEQFRNRATIEIGRMASVDIEPVDVEGTHFRRYRGKWFTLDSTADEPSTRRLVVRTEQIFAAYRQILPPRTAPDKPPRLVVYGSWDEYEACLARLGLKIQNRACFLEKENLVLAGTELVRLASLTAVGNAENERLRGELKALEKRLPDRLRELSDQLKKDRLARAEIARLMMIERRKFEDQCKKIREQIDRGERQSARIFDRNMRQTFTRLYHESFHAYLQDYVYPSKDCDVPLWLNEGLAVMFEGGVLDGDRLRVDTPDPEALKRLQADLRGGSPLSLEKLLAAGSNEFLAIGDAAQAADRYYLYAWGLTYYLTFERQLLSGPALDRYVRRVNPGLTLDARFQQLTSMPLNQLEGQWIKYILSLRSNGR